MMPARITIGGSPNASSGRHNRQAEDSPRGVLSFAGKPLGRLGRKRWSMGTNIGGRAAESNCTGIKGRPGRRGRFVHFGHVLPARRHIRRAQAFRAVVKHRSSCHPHLGEFEELLALVGGARRARPLYAFVGDLTVFVGPGHTGSSLQIQAGAQLVSQSPTPGPVPLSVMRE